ncbi:MAG: hypothetical protein K8E24_015445, partial [Methanobacterium paludis]|nr:hypothetical protein [Methanobacterium paludis]
VVVVGEEYSPNPFKIEDANGNNINKLFFESMYPQSVATKHIKISTNMFIARNVNITLGNLATNLIPASMRTTSVDSYKYMQLSLDNVTFSDSITISSIPINTVQDLYVKCTVPSNVVGGNFMADLEIQIEA